MLDFRKVNCEIKIRQNIVQVWETIKAKISCFVTTKEAYSEDISSRVSSSLLVLTQYQNKYC